MTAILSGNAYNDLGVGVDATVKIYLATQVAAATSLLTQTTASAAQDGYWSAAGVANVNIYDIKYEFTNGQVRWDKGLTRLGGVPRVKSTWTWVSGTTNLLVRDTQNQLTFDTSEYDNLNFHAGATWQILTIPHAGCYRVTGYVVWASSVDTSGGQQIYLVQNSTEFIRDTKQNWVSQPMHQTCSQEIECALGDTLKLYATHNTTPTPRQVLYAKLSVTWVSA